MGRYLAALLVAGGVLAQGQLWISGTWDLTFELLPNTRVYESELKLNVGFAPGWRLESESKIYSDGLLRYQNFYLSGSFGDFGVWGKIYFHAQERRYQKMWVNAEIPLGGGTFRSSFNHWASAADYSSGDKDMFGSWPCVDVVSWEDAWKFMTREVYVTGPVASYLYAGDLILDMGEAFPGPNRVRILVPEANVAAFETAFGSQFWTGWVGKTVCVKGTVKGRRYTSGGPGGGGYSVAEVSLSDPSKLSVGTCPGVMISATCPGPTVKWFYAKNHAGQTVYVQGPVASITGPGTYYGYPNHYRVRIGGGDGVDNRVEVILPYNPGWSTAGSSYTNEVCVYGTVTQQGVLAVILPPNVISTSGSPCCPGGGLPGMFLNWRFRYALDPWTFTVDFGDCCTGFSFRQLSVAGTGLPLCCGLTFDASFSFTKAGFNSLAFTLKYLPLFCCGLTADLSVKFTPESKTVTFAPQWSGFGGCLTIYGDAIFNGMAFQGIAVYGFGITCYVGDVKLRLVTAFDPDKVEDMTDLSFYTGEWEYVGLTYTGFGCCGGGATFTSEFWFGNQGVLFDLQRFKLTLDVPITAGFVLFTKVQLDLSDTPPLDYLDIGWKLSF